MGAWHRALPSARCAEKTSCPITGKHKRRRTRGTHEAPGRTDLEAARREEAASVRAALNTLPEGQFRAIELAFFAGLSPREIAAQLGMPLGTVKGRIRLGIDKLKDELRGMTDTAYTSTTATSARNT